MKDINLSIEEIAAEETLGIRRDVMWPGKPLEYVKLQDDSEGLHFGLKLNGELVTVVSLFVKNEEAQFRKLATISAHQGNGYASLMLDHIITLSQNKGVTKLWCNARVNKTGFYHKIGMYETDQKFSKGGIDYVIMEKNI
ncbi:GNAT family N-acetyltransferase [Labilibacter sediminis]|nr:GNAT family N-acetyltransferase [Labilibacter sediminis]